MNVREVHQDREEEIQDDELAEDHKPEEIENRNVLVILPVDISISQHTVVPCGADLCADVRTDQRSCFAVSKDRTPALLPAIEQ